MQRKHSIELSSGSRIAFIAKAIVVLAQHSPVQNGLLAALPSENYAHLLPHLELDSLPQVSIVYSPGELDC